MIQARFRRRSWALLTAGLLTLAVARHRRRRRRRPRASRSPWAPRTSRARRPSRRPTGRRSRTRATTSASRTTSAPPRSSTRRSRTATSTATPTTRARCSRTSAARRPATRPRRTRRCRPSSRAPTSSASKPAPAVDVNGFYVTKATAKKYKLKNVSDLTKQSPQAHVRRTARVRGAPALPRRHVAAALRPRVQGGQEARRRRPDHGAGARGRRHRRRPPLHRQQRDPEGRGAAQRRQGPAAGRQPGVPHHARTRPRRRR